MAGKRVSAFEISVFTNYLKICLEQLYKECEHGDEEHRQWLKDKFDDFYKRQEEINGSVQNSQESNTSS